MTNCVSSSVAAATRACAPNCISGHSRVRKELALRNSVRLIRLSESATTTSFGRNSRIWELRSSTFLPATREKMENSSGRCRTTSSVLVPMDPVDPNRVMFVIVSIAAGGQQLLRCPEEIFFENLYKKCLHSRNSYSNIGIKPGRQLPPK